jgi:hypothetical protein
MSECPLCHGEEKIVVVVPHKFLDGRFKTSVHWCICKKAEFVSESPDNTILSNLEGDVIPLDKIKLEFNPNQLSKNPNLLIRGHYDTFLNHLRSLIIKYRYMDPPSSIYCCNSIDVLQRFYVGQSDGTCLGLSETEKYDLLVICLGNKQKNEQLKTCIAEVVYSRKKKKKPVWIYLPYPTLTQCLWETSQELEEYIKEYEFIEITEDGIKIDRTPKKVSNSASNFNGV